MSIIIKPSHHHSNQFEDQEINEGTLPILQAMLEKSQSFLNQRTIQEIGKIRRYHEDKVYKSFTNAKSQYLVHMKQKSQSQMGDFVGELVQDRMNRVLEGISIGKYEVKVMKQEEKIKRIKEELMNKISQMKHSLDSFGDSAKDQEKANEIYKAYVEFRQKGYWNEETQQSKKVKQFLQKMKKEKKSMEQMRQKNWKKMQQNIQNSIQYQKRLQQEQQKKVLQYIIQKREKAKSERKLRKQDQMKRLAEAGTLIQKVKVEKPIFLANEQKYKKEVLQPIQEQRKRKLNEIKKLHRPLNTQQLQEHEKKYEQNRQKLLQAYQRREQQNMLHSKNYQKLKQLYHGHYHQKVQQQAITFRDELQQKRRIREKIISYSANVKEEFKPRADPRKRQELQNTLKLLQLRSYEIGKRKIKNEDGSVTFEEISPDEGKRLGVSYLEHLKKFNQGRKRKDPQERSSSMMELSKITKQKIIYPDYLKQMRSKSRVETAVSKPRNNGWRKILKQQSFTNRDKYTSVMDHVSVLQTEAKQKQIQLKFMKNSSKAMQLKQKLDQYYLQSLSAKMHVLKDVILKQ